MGSGKDGAESTAGMDLVFAAMCVCNACAWCGTRYGAVSDRHSARRYCTSTQPNWSSCFRLRGFPRLILHGLSGNSGTPKNESRPTSIYNLVSQTLNLAIFLLFRHATSSIAGVVNLVWPSQVIILRVHLCLQHCDREQSAARFVYDMRGSS